VDKDEAEKGRVHISNFVKQRKHTNIITVSAPKRHDLSTTSCVNNEMTTYNKITQEMMFEHVKIPDSEVQRGYCTRHGLHINTVGKELMAQKIMDHIRKTLIVRETLPIILKWRQDLMDSGQEGIVAEEKITFGKDLKSK
jgi:hypothetical protein